MWDFKTATAEKTLTGHGWDVRSVDWHPAMALIASGAKDALVRLWDPRQQQSGSDQPPLATLYGHKSAVLDVRWSPCNQGAWLAASSRDQLIKVFDLRMMREFATFRSAPQSSTATSGAREINAIAWHPQHERLLASGSGEGVISYWLVDGASTSNSTSFSSPSSSPAFFASQKNFETAPNTTSTNTMLPERNRLGHLPGAHDGVIWSLDWHPLGHMLLSASADCTVRWWTRVRPGDAQKDRFTMGVGAAQAAGVNTALFQYPSSQGGAGQDDDNDSVSHQQNISRHPMPSNRNSSSRYAQPSSGRYDRR